LIVNLFIHININKQALFAMNTNYSQDFFSYKDGYEILHYIKISKIEHITCYKGTCEVRLTSKQIISFHLNQDYNVKYVNKLFQLLNVENPYLNDQTNSS